AHGRIAQRDWLGVERLPAHAPDLNPVERVWSVMRNGLSNLVLGDIDQLAALIRARPRPMQYRPELLQGCLAGIGLSLQPGPDEFNLSTAPVQIRDSDGNVISTYLPIVSVAGESRNIITAYPRRG